jgi:hypothetical protein
LIHDYKCKSFDKNVCYCNVLWFYSTSLIFLLATGHLNKRTKHQTLPLLQKILNKKFKLGRFELLSISKIGPCLLARNSCTC